MANSKIEVIDIKEQPDSFSVEYKIDGEINGHTFPKEDHLLIEDEDGNPEWVNKLVELELMKEKDKKITNLKKEYIIKSSKKDKIKDKKIPKFQLNGSPEAEP